MWLLFPQNPACFFAGPKTKTAENLQHSVEKVKSVYGYSFHRMLQVFFSHPVGPLPKTTENLQYSVEKVNKPSYFSFHRMLQVFSSVSLGVSKKPAENCGKSNHTQILLFPQYAAGFQQF